MMLDAEEEALPMPLPPQPEIFPQAENQAPARKVVRKIADEFLNLSIKIGGKEQLDKYVEDYETFNGKGDSANKLLADDILRTLINEKKMTKMEAGVVFKIGSGRWHRIKKVVPVDQPVEIRLPYGRNGSQMEEREMQVLSNFVESLQTTEAFPCNHRKIKKYLADVDSWKSLWDSYKVFAEGENRVMQYSTFHKYIRSRHSEFALIKSKEEDDCETCFRLKTIIHDSRVREEDKEAAKTRLKEHSIEERAMTSHIKEAIKLYGKDLLLNKDRRIISEFMRAVDCIPETFDEPMRDLIVYNRTTGVDEVVRLQCEGFSTPFNMPYHSGRKRGMDDSLSAVLLHTYVINDFHSGLNRMYMYDERTLGQDLDSISSIRFLHHMRLFIETRSGPTSVKQPDVLYLIMDDSVGPEKSQEGLMFYVILSLLFYKKVVCHYLPESHSTMCADRAVTHARRIFGGAINEFHPSGLVAQLNDTTLIQAEYFDHENGNLPLFEDWNLLLKSFFLPIPTNFENNCFQKNNFFEFSEGNVTVRKNISAEHSFVHQYIKNESVSNVRTRLLTSLFGHTNLESAEISDLQLPKHAVKRLDEKTLAGLRLKIPTIPVENLGYYESEEKDTVELADRSRPTLSGVKRGRPTLKSSTSTSNSSNTPDER